MVVAESPVKRVEDGAKVPRGAVVGVVIAGGRSRRFGGEKAIAELRGKPLLVWAAERLGRSCARVAVNARPGSDTERLARARTLPVLHDSPGDAEGALAGVKAGLAWASGSARRTGRESRATRPYCPTTFSIG